MGKCKWCQCELQSNTAVACVKCYKEHMKLCPTCHTERGMPVKKYRGHRQNGRYVQGKLCPTCLGERFIITD